MAKLQVHIPENVISNTGHIVLDDRIEAWARGYAFLGEKLLKGRVLAELVASRWSSSTDKDEVFRWIRELNGCFFFVAICNGKVLASVDRIRSRPLFYARKGSQLWISDDAYWIRDALGTYDEDPVARQEYLFTGYVTGADTLHPKIKQLRTGEAMFADERSGQWNIETERYYRFWHKPSEKNEEKLAELFDEVLEASFERLIRYAEGRTIVVPLSAGYDSRLIVLMLKKLGYENIATFTFGIADNWDSEGSRLVAEGLGVPWHFIEYTHEKWYRWYRSAEMKEYLAKCDNLCAFPFISTWPALGELKKQGMIPVDSVMVPGVSIGELFGAQTNRETLDGQNDTETVIQSIISIHYSMWPAPTPGQELQKALCEKLRKHFAGYTVKSKEDAANLFELWEWEERQAKAIINTARNYEYLDYDWYFLSCDSEILEFIEQIPLDLRLEKLLAMRYISKLSHDVIGRDVPFGKPSSTQHKKKSPLRSFRRRVFKILPQSTRKMIKKSIQPTTKNRIRLRADRIDDIQTLTEEELEQAKAWYNSHRWALYGVMTEEEFIQHQAWRVPPAAIWIWDKLGGIELSNDTTGEPEE